MAAMDLKVGSQVVGMILNIKRQPQSRKVMNTALDGSVYVQNTGSPIRKYQVDFYCGTPEDRDRVDDACNEGDVVTIITREEVEVEGFIEDQTIPWNEWVDGHGVGRFVLVQR